MKNQIVIGTNRGPTIVTMQINASYQDRVRDQFILLAWTGCRYSDLPKLKKGNIHPWLHDRNLPL